MKKGWKSIAFSTAPVQIIDGDRGKNYPKQTDFSDLGYCVFLNTGNVTESGLSFRSVQFISEEKDNALRKGKLKRDDIVMTTRGTIGNVAHYNDKILFDHMRINSGMVVFRCDQSQLSPLFLYHFLRSPNFHGQVNALRSGVAQPQLPIRDINHIKLPLPPLDEQSRIASFISNYDDLIENNRRRIQLLEQSARLLYKEWFVRLRFPGHEHVKIKDGVPEGWEKVATPEIVEINPTERIQKGTEVWYVPMASLSSENMTLDRSDFERRIEYTTVKFRNGDVLFARITPCLENGKTGFVNFLNENEPACGSTEFIVLRGREVSPYFTYCLARSYDFRENAIKSMIGSSGRQRVQTSCLKDFFLPLPSKVMLNQFDEAVFPCFSQIQILCRQNESLSKARDLLHPRLMNGEVEI